MRFLRHSQPFAYKGEEEEGKEKKLAEGKRKERVGVGWWVGGGCKHDGEEGEEARRRETGWKRGRVCERDREREGGGG